MQNFSFVPEQFLPKALIEAISEIRLANPDVILDEANRRARRPRLCSNGHLMIVATDHPARRVTAIREDSLAMGDRHSCLARALRVLTAPGCDGIMGTPDFMEDLLILSHVVRGLGGPSFLDEKVLIGCMNRGGLDGLSGEIDDRFTAFSARQLKRMRFEGGKMMYRLDLADDRSVGAIDDCSRRVTELNRQGLYCFLEPLSVRRRSDGTYETIKDVEALVKDAGVASALGESSAKTFLKLPYTEGYERVARSTCLPILMLGGAAQESPSSILHDFHSGMRAGKNIAGVMVGRNVTFVNGDDPRAATTAVSSIVHDGSTVEGALKLMSQERGREMDLISRYSATGRLGHLPQRHLG